MSRLRSYVPAIVNRIVQRAVANNANVARTRYQEMEKPRSQYGYEALTFSIASAVTSLLWLVQRLPSLPRPQVQPLLWLLLLLGLRLL